MGSWLVELSLYCVEGLVSTVNAALYNFQLCAYMYVCTVQGPAFECLKPSLGVK